jgi:hypothetical protein
MRTRWTEALLDRVREHAASGDSCSRTAYLLNVPESSLSVVASRHRIRFKSRKRGRKSAAIKQLAVQLAARNARAREIAAAKAEAPQAPLYRGWPG